MTTKKEIKFYSSFINGEYFFLSNFYKKIFYTTENGIKIKWKTSEHYYQYKKLKFLQQFSENIITKDNLQEIIDANTPKQAKLLGHKTYKHIEEWDKIKIEEMKTVLLSKFNDPFMSKKLLETEDAILVENSPYDYYWGCGANNSGDNMLGILLMEVREEIKQKKIKQKKITDFI